MDPAEADPTDAGYSRTFWSSVESAFRRTFC